MLHRNITVVLSIIVISLLVNPHEALSTPGKGSACKRVVAVNKSEVVERSNDTATISRRTAIGTFLSGGMMMTSLVIPPPPAQAAEVIEENSARESLLRSIQPSSKNNEMEVMGRIQNLIQASPSMQQRTSLKEDLDGEWKLLWSAKADAFSPLLKLPKPFKPDSYQYFGDAASIEVGENRVAQGLTGGILGKNQLWLSSGSVPSELDPSALIIQPPFRFEIGGRYLSGKPKKVIVEAESDAEFRQVNGRTEEAQVAPKNTYEQIYVEQKGKGSLRISTITDGDPVIVGAIFIHEKL